MHPPQLRQQALDLIAAGHNDCEVSRRLGVPRRTILDWRRPAYVRRREIATETCPRCWQASKPMRFTPDDYAELLALYLGDGCISEMSRTHRLRIALDTKYPMIIEEAHDLVARCFPFNDCTVLRKGLKGNVVNVSVYSNHLPCLFPQHGPGPKHRRPMVLEKWQRELVEGAPWPFIRGCIRSDGCCFINRTDVHRSEPYEYLSYGFSNMSGDIAHLFAWACELVGVACRLPGPGRRGLWQARINRRESVAVMVEHVGLKA